jgi:hypothetical protein
MADIRATQSGAFEATSTWFGGVVPGSGDVAFANTFTVTISDTRTVQAISNASGTSITVGGTFSLLNGANLTCTNANGVVQGATATSCITTPNLTVGSSASVAAAIAHTAAATTNSSVAFSTSGTLNLTGAIVGPSAVAALATVAVSGTGTLNLNGNVTAGTVGGGAAANGINITGNASVNITGNVTGSASPSGTHIGININSSGCNVTINGNVTGGAGSTTTAAISNTTGTLTVNGACQSSSSAPAIAAGGAGQITRLSGPFLLGASGNINPVQAQSWRWAPTLVPTYLEVAQSNGSTKRLLYSADNMPSGGYPVAGNVRQSTVYGPSSEFTGTLAVPSASSVALGVASDNTTGTAILTAENVRAAIGMASANLDSQLAGLSSGGGGSAPSAATVASAVRSELTTELARIDVATSTRLAAASYTAPTTPPTAAAVASQVRTELSTELARLDAAVSTRLAAASYAAAPTTAAIRTELSTELARLDVAVSTRLAPAGTLARVTLTDTTTNLTNASGSAPSAATVATAVRTELTPELARVANCATVDTTATAIQDAVSG